MVADGRQDGLRGQGPDPRYLAEKLMMTMMMEAAPSRSTMPGSFLDHTQ